MLRRLPSRAALPRPCLGALGAVTPFSISGASLPATPIGTVPLTPQARLASSFHRTWTNWSPQPSAGRRNGSKGSSAPARGGATAFNRQLQQWVRGGGSAEAATRLLAAFTSNAKKINLTRLALKDLPRCVVQLHELRDINLASNDLARIPEPLLDMPWLVGLNVSRNPLSLPDDFKGLEGLESLQMCGCRLKALPNSIQRLGRLRTLSLAKNLLADLPEELNKLAALEELDLSRNRPLRGLPPFVFSLPRLRSLVLDGCSFALDPRLFRHPTLRRLSARSLRTAHPLPTATSSDLLSVLMTGAEPLDAAAESQLDDLDLTGNRLEALPAWIGDLTRLTALRLSDTSLQAVPSELLRLRELRLLSLDHNNIETLDARLLLLPKLEELTAASNGLSKFLNEAEAESELKKGLSLLRVLQLQHNELRRIPPLIGGLLALETLRMQGATGSWWGRPDRIVSLPRCLGRLQRLKLLDVTGVALRSLPDEIGKLRSLVRLNLSRCALRCLPTTIGNLHALKHLDVGSNRLRALPKSVASLSNLRVLNCRHNALLALPDRIGELKKLNDLHLDYNRLRRLPESFSQLNLRRVDLTDNQLRELPQSIGDLPVVEELDTRGNRLWRLPESICRMKSLTTLNVSDNRLVWLPKSLCNLRKLQVLDASENRLSSLPARLGHSPKLTRLRAAYNRIRRLPNPLGEFRQLTNLDLDGNRLSDLPTFRRDSKLQNLSLHANRFRRLPWGIGRLRRLRHLQFDATHLDRKRIGSLRVLYQLKNLRWMEVTDLPAHHHSVLHARRPGLYIYRSHRYRYRWRRRRRGSRFTKRRR